MTEALPTLAATAQSDRAVAQSLAIDWITACVLRALGQAQVEPLLLKGPAVASLLYAEGTPRRYHDCDLLVSPADLATAERVLGEQGFEPFLQRERGFDGHQGAHAQAWIRAMDGANVDLHNRLAFTAQAQAAAVWQLLRAGTRVITVSGVAARALDKPRLALVVGLHAAQHGRHEQVAEDLRRAIARFGYPVWLEAIELSRMLEVEHGVATGLWTLPEGRELARRLRLSSPASVESWLTLSSAPAGAAAMQRLRRISGARAKLRFAHARVFPSAEFMRGVWPLAHRGKAGLTAAYTIRAAALAARAGPAVRSWRQAERRARAANLCREASSAPGG